MSYFANFVSNLNFNLLFIVTNKIKADDTFLLKIDPIPKSHAESKPQKRWSGFHTHTWLAILGQTASAKRIGIIWVAYNL